MASVSSTLPPQSLKWTLVFELLSITSFVFFLAAVLSVFPVSVGADQEVEPVSSGGVKRIHMTPVVEGNRSPTQNEAFGTVLVDIADDVRRLKIKSTKACIPFGECQGSGTSIGASSAFFLSVGASLLDPHRHPVRLLIQDNPTQDVAVMPSGSARAMIAGWGEGMSDFALFLFICALVCTLQYLVISKALRPVWSMSGALNGIARGDLSRRLPDVPFREFQLVSGTVNTLVNDLENTLHERRGLARRLVDEQESGLRHLARELHDEFAQHLSAISMVAASIKVSAENGSRPSIGEARQLCEATKTAMVAVRETLHTLRSPQIKGVELPQRLSSLVEKEQRRYGERKTISLQTNVSLEALSTTAASHVFRIVQEGLTNVGRHSDASWVQVRLVGHEPRSVRHPCLVLTIENNGCRSAGKGLWLDGPGYGLVGIQERIWALGGRLEISRPEEDSFRLHAVIPFGSNGGLCNAPEQYTGSPG